MGSRDCFPCMRDWMISTCVLYSCQRCSSSVSRAFWISACFFFDPKGSCIHCLNFWKIQRRVPSSCAVRVEGTRSHSEIWESQLLTMGRLFLFIRYREKYSKLILDLLHICTDQFNQLYIDHLQIANFIIPSENPPTTSSRANEVSRGNWVTRWSTTKSLTPTLPTGQIGLSQPFRLRLR